MHHKNILGAKFDHAEEIGLPENYPVPNFDDKTLFYIQRNRNMNTVVYELNYSAVGEISEDFPMHPYWIKYTQGGSIMELNKFQNELAYGYKSRKINHSLYEFEMVSYDKLKFYIVKAEDSHDHYVVTTIKGVKSRLSNIFVFAEEYGIFPQVKYFELFGEELNTGFSVYEKIVL